MTKTSFQKIKNARVNKSTVSIVAILFLITIGAIMLSKSGFNLIDVISRGRATDVGDTSVDHVKTASVFRQVAKPIYLQPIKLQFKEKMLQVEEISVDEGGFLSVPSSWQTAGWYKEGAKAGEEGNVVVDGHYDTNTGAPGAFWELKDLQVGDKVLLTDKLGRVFTYSVNNKSYISISDPERSKVFASGKDKILTLITCGGVWDYASGTYNKRLVITAVFDKMEKSW